ERLSGERHEAGAIAAALKDELLHLLLGDLQTVPRLEVLREHRAREVYREDDVDPLRGDVLRMRAGTRSRERHDESREHEVAEHEERASNEAARARSARQHIGMREG